MPRGIQILLRGRPVEHYGIASDVEHRKAIKYKPRVGNSKDSASTIVIVGFPKEARLFPVHGFNVYHNNRLVKPFWKV